MELAVLNDILRQYERKRINNNIALEKRRAEVYKSCPKLEEIDRNLNSISITAAKSILASHANSAISSLEKDLNKLRLEKVNLLKELNLSGNYLEPIYDCEICKDTGYAGTEMCSCLKQEVLNAGYNKANIINLSKENFDTFNSEYYSDKANKLYGTDMSPRGNIELIKTLCFNFIDNFDDPNEKNLLFVGNSGTGKTFMSNCIAKKLLDQGKTVMYQTAPVLFDTIITNRFDKNVGPLNVYQNLLNVDLLIIDDLGTETTNSMIFSELFNLINTRILNNAKTIISTNLSLNELFSKYDERITSRLIGNYTACKFFGDDIRLIKKGLKI